LFKKGGGPNGSGVTHPPGPNQQQDERGLLPQVASRVSNEKGPAPIRRKSLSARDSQANLRATERILAFYGSAMPMTGHTKVACSFMLSNKKQSFAEALA